ncbi:hypothetical protein NQZ68_018365 [Dissostichus eleginoides]|nr:hypothetical protein NQZ68_018365 [Dissostichus eleginoides]
MGGLWWVTLSKQNTNEVVTAQLFFNVAFYCNFPPTWGENYDVLQRDVGGFA